ncbi:Rieske (2Fe-2S) protein [Tautonia rosea]|uniref:Rieske (2Fe-2S) protein n=1 Tax=Tautonia rosea TaxID=2728037 RepID=UPI001475AF03|nr:Rieske (2Fe-2S) protein [Tautonia rosea]
MPEFVTLARLEDLPPGSSKEVEYEGKIVALFNLDGAIVAVDGICPHQGGPLADGVCRGGVVTCPWHGWQFNLRDGRSTTFNSIRIPVFEVRIEGEAIQVAVT